MENELKDSARNEVNWFACKSRAREAFGVFAYHRGLREEVWAGRDATEIAKQACLGKGFPVKGSLQVRSV